MLYMVNEGNQTMTTPDQALRDLTLALIYLTRQANSNTPADYWRVDSFRSWKSYDWDTLDKLDSEELIINIHRNKSVIITEEGVKRAREILRQYGIKDWKPEKQNDH